MKPVSDKRDKYLRKTYGISLAQYDLLLKGQNGVCVVCLRGPKEGKNLCVDHNHISREIRGLLCNYCNRRIVGRHRDSDLLRRVAAYLDQGTGWFVPVKKKRKKRGKVRRR